MEGSTREFWELFDRREGIVEKAGVLQSGGEHMAQYRHPKEPTTTTRLPVSTRT